MMACCWVLVVPVHCIQVAAQAPTVQIAYLKRLHLLVEAAVVRGQRVLVMRLIPVGLVAVQAEAALQRLVALVQLAKVLAVGTGMPAVRTTARQAAVEPERWAGTQRVP